MLARAPESQPTLIGLIGADARVDDVDGTRSRFREAPAAASLQCRRVDDRSWRAARAHVWRPLGLVAGLYTLRGTGNPIDRRETRAAHDGWVATSYGTPVYPLCACRSAAACGSIALWTAARYLSADPRRRLASASGGHAQHLGEFGGAALLQLAALCLDSRVIGTACDDRASRWSKHPGGSPSVPPIPAARRPHGAPPIY
jgi:hypothetical protein